MSLVAEPVPPPNVEGLEVRADATLVPALVAEPVRVVTCQFPLHERDELTEGVDSLRVNEGDDVGVDDVKVCMDESELVTVLEDVEDAVLALGFVDDNEPVDELVRKLEAEAVIEFEIGAF